MKEKRHSKILEIITRNSVETQEELQHMLSECGCNVTQATVSRDIRELKLVKILDDDNNYRYVPADKTSSEDKMRFEGMFRSAVTVVDYALNTVVIKCHTGMAQAVCASLDKMEYSDVVGTIAGDDTIFVLLRSETSAKKFAETIQRAVI